MDESVITTQLNDLREIFQNGVTRDLAYRRRQLDGLERFLVERGAEIEQALFADLGKPPIEAFATETSFALGEVKLAKKNLKKWAAPKSVSTPLQLKPGSSKIYPEPYGVVLIISPWNYPLQLTLVPLIGALAAGNCVVIKPSELAPATSRLLATELPNYLESRSVAVIEGGVEETTFLLSKEFDYLFYTGNGKVGKIVMEAAANYLTPMTLELGGKSPCLVDADTDIKTAARRIAWGKFANAGQTCIAPDYLLVHESIHDELLEALKNAVTDFYGDDPAKSPDYGRIINGRHHQRLMGLIGKNADIVIGGQASEEDRYIAPTIIKNVSHQDAVMQEEIFGPILPVISVKSMDAAIDVVRNLPKPLATYLFTNNAGLEKQLLARTSSGSVGLNNVMLQVGVPALPFGGVGPSGMGAYHGKAGFDTFTHSKSVFKRPMWFDPSFMYPPYKNILRSILRWMM